MKMSKLGLLFTVFVLIILSACSSSKDGGDSSGEPDKPKDPVTLSVLVQVPGMTDEEFELFFTNPVREKHPHISIDLIRQGPDTSLDQLIMAGAAPDMVYGGPAVAGMLDLGYPLDLREPLRQHNIDISGITPNVVKSIEDYAPNSFYSIPFSMNAYALWYNVDIFDNFGVDYPTDGMTWDQAIELGKSLTRVVDGVQYRGIDVINASISNFASPLSLELLDASGNALIADQWYSLFARAMEAYNIPGNSRIGTATPRGHNLQPFTVERNLAMAPYWTNGMVSNLPNAAGLNWDVVQLPSFPEAPNTYIQSDYHQFTVNRTSPAANIEAAMEVLRVALSEEIQTQATRKGKLTVLQNETILNQFAADLDYMQGKNLEGIFKSQPAAKVPNDKYTDAVSVAINQAFFRIMLEGEDINTALRTAKEQADLNIQSLRQQ